MLIPFPQNRQPVVKIYGCVYAHNALIHELGELFPKKADRDVFRGHFERRIELLSENLGREHLIYRSWFEILKDEEYRSMKFHVAMLGNTRILYYIDSGSAYLLCAFKEKKKGTDYRPALRTADARRKDIEGGAT